MNTWGGQTAKEGPGQRSLCTDKESVEGAQWWSWGWHWFQRGVEMFWEGSGQDWNGEELWKNALAETGDDASAAKWLAEGWRKAWDWKLEAGLHQEQTC